MKKDLIRKTREEIAEREKQDTRLERGRLNTSAKFFKPRFFVRSVKRDKAMIDAHTEVMDAAEQLLDATRRVELAGADLADVGNQIEAQTTARRQNEQVESIRKQLEIAQYGQALEELNREGERRRLEHNAQLSSSTGAAAAAPEPADPKVQQYREEQTRAMQMAQAKAEVVEGREAHLKRAENRLMGELADGKISPDEFRRKLDAIKSALLEEE